MATKERISLYMTILFIFITICSLVGVAIKALPYSVFTHYLVFITTFAVLGNRND